MLKICILGRLLFWVVYKIYEKLLRIKSDIINRFFRNSSFKKEMLRKMEGTFELKE